MKVDLTNIAAEAPDSGAASRAGQAASAVNPGRSSATIARTAAPDETSFSFDQSRVRALAAQVLAQPEVRATKIQSLQQALGSNQYSVSPGQVADALSNEYGGSRA